MRQNFTDSRDNSISRNKGAKLFGENSLSLSFFLSGNEKHGINLVRYIRKLGRVTFIFVYDRDADFDADFTGTVFAEFVSFYLGETILYRNISFDSGGTNSGR